MPNRHSCPEPACELSDRTRTTRSANGCQLANLLRKWEDEKTEKLKEPVGNLQGKNRNKTGIRLNRSLNAIARSDAEANPFVFAESLDLVVPLESLDRSEALTDGL